ncbi:MAG: hypothetical protein SAK29_27555 [Scytonema sp. PMC 1069.18]|nr:hypothetical protein [Scytonema sp. PMC 1069.18]MEC4882354.1 hypothetical protein [Scytonema sp. PMC 1070.18]
MQMPHDSALGTSKSKSLQISLVERLSQTLASKGRREALPRVSRTYFVEILILRLAMCLPI